VDIVAANLPYIPSHVIPTLQPEVRDHEPRQALDGGPDGLRVIDRLLGQVPAHLRDGHGTVILEIGFDQAEPLRALVAERLPGADLTFRRDLAGIERVAVIHV
jgi:release factor glutamine methyltransferase